MPRLPCTFGFPTWIFRLDYFALCLTSLIGSASRIDAAEGLLQASIEVAPSVSEEINFSQQILPLFQDRCTECHQAEPAEGGVNFVDRDRFFAGGDHGPIIVAGNSHESPLIHRITSSDPDTRMPPEGDRLSNEQIDLLRAWIDQGANWPKEAIVDDPRLERGKKHWAFQPLRAINPPSVKNQAWPKTPIDAFILARLEGAGLEPLPSASPRQLIRRISMNLVGLPPTPEEVDAFVLAAAQDWDGALESLVDRLLSSIHYGERWGRHWLDVARYADSDGQESDRDRPNAYHYRDFVIRAFHEDLPYDEFVRWQLAGDECRPDHSEAVAATGFLAAGPFAALPDRLMEDERLRNRYNEMDDMLSTIGTGFLGLTLGCARCHDHKYDAIPARDYYQLMSALHSGERAEVPLGTTGEKTLGYHDLGPQPLPTWLFRRGNYYDHELPVSLGFITLLTNGKSPEAYLREARATSTTPNSTLQRRALAEWITDVEQGGGALLARVIVNRVWQHHFGEGIVRTVGDFGVRSEAPTHPELLEWLATDLVQHHWQLKRLQRMIVLSAVSLQSTRKTPTSVDAEQRLLSGMPLRRLEGEILRDAMLAVSGTLNLKTFGPAIRVPIAAEAKLARNLTDPYPDQIADSPEIRRRSIYLFHKRVVPEPLLQAFDKPDAQQSCSRRDRTTVAPQALALLNDPFVRTVATEFADRLQREKGDRSLEWIERSYQLALGRSPSETERLAALQFLTTQREARATREPYGNNPQRQALADYCQVIFGLNEFIYID